MVRHKAGAIGKLSNKKNNIGGNMKPKALNKRLVLNKKTIADLRKPEMDNVFGGGNTLPGTYCPFTVCAPTCICETYKETCGPLSVCICPDPTWPEC
jgi:hypothetical protein